MQEYFAEVSLPIRELVEFVLASGSIDNRYGGGDLYQRANEGSRLHRKLVLASVGACAGAQQ